MSTSSESVEKDVGLLLDETRNHLEVINIEGDDFDDKSEGTFDLEEPLNPLYELPDAHGTPTKRDKDAQNTSLKQRHQLLRKEGAEGEEAGVEKEEDESERPVLFDFKSPVHPHPSKSDQLGSGPLTYTILNEKEDENIDPDSLVEEGERESCSEKEEETSSQDNGVESSTYSNEAFEELDEEVEINSPSESDSTSSQESSNSCGSSNISSRRGGILSSDQSSAQDQRSGVSFFVDFDEEQTTNSPRVSPPSRKHFGPPMRRRTNTLDERMTQSVHEDRRSLDSHSSLSFYVDFSSSDHPSAKERSAKVKSRLSTPPTVISTPKPPPALNRKVPSSRNQSKLNTRVHLQKKMVSPTKKKVPDPPQEVNFETIKFFFKKLLKRVDDLACADDRQLSSVRQKKKLAERILEFIDEEEAKLKRGESLTPESLIDSCLNQEATKKPALRRERTFDLDSAEPKKLMLVEIDKNDSSKQRRNLKLFSQQKAFFLRRMKREMPKLDKRIKELEKQMSNDKIPSSKRITSRKQCWPMSDRELQIVEDTKPKRRLPAPTYPAPRLPSSKKLSQPNRMTQSLIEESPSGTSTSFLEIASKKQSSRERIKINVTDRSGISPSYSWYLNQEFSSNDDFEPEDEIVWIRRESPRRFYYEERSFYSPTILQRRSRFSDPEESKDYGLSHIPRPPPSSGRRASVNNFGQTFPSPSRKNSEALMSSGLAVRKTKGSSSRILSATSSSSSPISSRGVQTRDIAIYSPQWEERLASHSDIPIRGTTEYRRTEYIDLDTDEYVMESRRKIVSPPMKKNVPYSSKIPKTRSPYESTSSSTSSGRKVNHLTTRTNNRSKIATKSKSHSRSSNMSVP